MSAQRGRRGLPAWTKRATRKQAEESPSDWLAAARRRIEKANEQPAWWQEAPGPENEPIPAASVAASAQAEHDDEPDERVPAPLRIAADYGWRIGVVLVVTGMVLWLLSQISTLIIPLMVAALLSGLLLPVKRFFRTKAKLPNGLAVAATFVLFLAVVGGALTLAGATLAGGMRGLWEQALQGLDQVRVWLAEGPLHVTNDQLSGYLDNVLGALQNNSSAVLKNVAGVGSTVGHVGAGTLLALFALIFFLLEGERIWRFAVGLFPRRARQAVDGSGRRGWQSLVSYVRVQLVVALIDAVGIGLGAFFLNVPLALPLAVLVFLGSFIPIVGALITGALAVLLALVAHGWVVALIMLGVVLLVQQVESHILQPLIMGRAVSLHPLAVVLAVAGGSMLFGIAGALFSVPIMAVVNTVVKYLATRAWERDPAVENLSYDGPELVAATHSAVAVDSEPGRAGRPAESTQPTPSQETEDRP